MAARVTKAEAERRVEEVIGWILAGNSRIEKVRKAADQWGISERQLDTYHARATEVLREQNELNREDQLARAVALRQKIIRLDLAADRTDRALRAADSMDKLLGLFVEKVETKHTGLIDPAGRTPEELAAELQAAEEDE